MPAAGTAGLAAGQARAPSVPQLPVSGDNRGPGLRSRSQELPRWTPLAPRTPETRGTSTSASTSDVGFLPSAIGPNTSIEEAQEDPPPLGLPADMLHLAEGSFVEQPGWRPGGGNPDLSWGSPFHEALGGREARRRETPEDTEGGPALSLEEASAGGGAGLTEGPWTLPRHSSGAGYQILTFRERLKVCALSAGGTPCLLMVP